MLLTVTQKLLEGFGTSCIIFIVTLLAALPLGLVIAFGSMSRFKPIKWITRGFVWIMRGTPLMLQLMIVYYGPGLLWEGNSVSKLSAVLIAFSVNYAAYFSEIYRGGIESIPRGQYEAGQVLGMTKSQIFFKVTLLQMVKRIVPPMSNEVITLVKDTSLAKTISIMELIMTGESYMKSAGIVWPLFYTAVFYLAFVGILTLLFNYIERKLSYFR